MGRYSNTRSKEKIVKRGEKDKVNYNITSLKSTKYDLVTISDKDIFVITQDGDRLDILAQKYYGDVNLWWYIAKANNLKFMTLPIGTRLRIPSDAGRAFAKGR